MKQKMPLGLVLVAILQFIPPLIMAPSSLTALNPLLWLPVILVFVILAVFLLRRRSWSRTATVFVQGFNIIVRILISVGHIIRPEEMGGGLNTTMIVTSLLSIGLSWLILSYVDTPDIQLQMQG